MKRVKIDIMKIFSLLKNAENFVDEVSEKFGGKSQEGSETREVSPVLTEFAESMTRLDVINFYQNTFNPEIDSFRNNAHALIKRIVEFYYLRPQFIKYIQRHLTINKDCFSENLKESMERGLESK